MEWLCSPVPVFPGDKASSKQCCLLYVYGVRRALPAQTNWFHFVFSYILPSKIVCLGTRRWEREDWAYKLSQALEPQQQLRRSGLGAADSQVPSESPQLSVDELYRETN